MLTGVTITGADDGVKHAELAALSEAYPFVEWGILRSEGRVGTPRYPREDWCAMLALWAGKMKLSMHLCGEMAKRLLLGEGELLGGTYQGQRIFPRVQVNGYAPTAGDAFQHGCWQFPDVEVILQVRFATSLKASASEARQLPKASLLFDPSGGRGIALDAMPKLPGGRMGYAGGIHPKNVLDVIKRIEEFTPDPFWIDMETGVRDKEDRFDLARVREVLEKVKGVIKP